MKKIIKFVGGNWDYLLLGVFVIIGLVLRFTNITKLYFFTYDQARDDLIVKRILVDKKFTLLGPQSSIGGVYLPPAYYYTLSLPLWLFGLNPVGPDVYTAFIGISTVILIFFAANSLFGRPSGFFAATLLATSPIMVELSRRAWNPNTLPFFSLLALVLAYRFWNSNQEKLLFPASLVFGYTLSLHYSAFCLLPVTVYLWVNYFLKKKRILPIILSFSIIFCFFLPLLLFDFRHGFALSKNIVSIFSQKATSSQNLPSFPETSLASLYEVMVVPLSGYFLTSVPKISVPYEFIGRISDVFSKLLPVSIIAHKSLFVNYYSWGKIIFLLILVFSLFKIFASSSKNKALLFIWIWFISAIVLSRLYQGKIYFFYYLFLFPIPFLFWSVTLKWLFDKKGWFRIFVFSAVLAVVAVNIKNERLNFTAEVNNRSITDIKAVAKIISLDADSKSFNIATNHKDPGRWDHHALDYRYFVETLFKKKPLDWYPENYKESLVLYLVSEGKLDDPLSSKIMEVQEFGPGKIENTWNYKDKIFVYKLSKR